MEEKSIPKLSAEASLVKIEIQMPIHQNKRILGRCIDVSVITPGYLRYLPIFDISP